LGQSQTVSLAEGGISSLGHLPLKKALSEFRERLFSEIILRFLNRRTNTRIGAIEKQAQNHNHARSRNRRYDPQGNLSIIQHSSFLLSKIQSAS
jgi:hypothetical protein